MNFNELELLVDLVDASQVSEVAIRNGSRRISIRRGQSPKKVETSAIAIRPASPPNASVLPMDPRPTAKAALVIHSHIVGIFRHAEPPIGLGTTVVKGQIVGAIESMKLMNDVRSALSGVVQEIDVEGGMAVEYGQPLFILSAPNEE